MATVEPEARLNMDFMDRGRWKMMASHPDFFAATLGFLTDIHPLYISLVDLYSQH